MRILPILIILPFIDALNESNEDTKAQFLSFEDWKKAKGVDHHQKDPQDAPNRQKTQSLHEPAFGEEMEIDLSNFFHAEQEEEKGKVYKDKFNFASFDCGASIVKTNSEAKGATSILFENKDSYLLNPCGIQNKFVTIELCQDILVDSVAIGNFEFFSSTFKKVSISVSDAFPVVKNGWKTLGVFDAEDLRDFQTFQIDNPMIWAKFLRVEILEHYGNEYYCPLSVVRVHGRTMIQEYKEEAGKVASENVTLVRKNDSALEPNAFDYSFNECPISLPALKFEEFFNDHSNSECEPSDYSPPQQTTQESIYKNIMKRLSLLEANATLSVLYVEEQSKLLSQAFKSLENSQSLKLDNIIQSFNKTINHQISNLDAIYQEYYQQTQHLLLVQKTQHQELLSESYSKINALSLDLRFQKIWSFINALILIGIFVYFILTREVIIDESYEKSIKPVNSSKPPSGRIDASINGLEIYTTYNDQVTDYLDENKVRHDENKPIIQHKQNKKNNKLQ